MSNAQLSSKPCFWYNGTTGEILTGMPEQFPAPRGYEKIVCNSAYEAERWSARQRAWDEFKHRIKQEERELIEGPTRDAMRKHLHHLMANASNNKNRDFLRRYIETQDGQDLKWKTKRESYLHAEAFEHGR